MTHFTIFIENSAIYFNLFYYVLNMPRRFYVIISAFVLFTAFSISVPLYLQLKRDFQQSSLSNIFSGKKAVVVTTARAEEEVTALNTLPSFELSINELSVVKFLQSKLEAIFNTTIASFNKMFETSETIIGEAEDIDFMSKVSNVIQGTLSSDLANIRIMPIYKKINSRGFIDYITTRGDSTTQSISFDVSVGLI